MNKKSIFFLIFNFKFKFKIVQKMTHVSTVSIYLKGDILIYKILKAA